MELGFEACTLQKYRRGPEELTLEIYRMADTAAALGIYLANCGRETPSPALDERHTAGQNQIMMVKGRFYVVITLSPDAKNGSTTLIEFAKRTAQKVPPASPPDVLALLPREGLMAGSTRILRGPVGLSGVTTLGEGDILTARPHGHRSRRRLPGKERAVADDDRRRLSLSGSRHRSLTHLRKTSTAISRPWIRVPGSLVFQDHKGLYGAGAVKGSRLTVQVGLAEKPTL